jgi:membrane protease YdiL (CAAX protease family)
MQPAIFDHLIVLALLIYFPLDGIRRMANLKRDAGANVPGVRSRLYRGIMLELWLVTIATLVFWATRGRAWSMLGLGEPGGEYLWIGLGVAGVAIAALIVQTVVATRTDPAKLRGSVESLGHLIPHDAGELRLFNAVSITAGVCEEVLYRGFLLAYLGAWMGWPAALVVSSLVFGLGHGYQGATGVIKAGLVGLLMGSIVLLTGSLWAAIILHAAIDLSAGRIGYRVYATPLAARS